MNQTPTNPERSTSAERAIELCLEVKGCVRTNTEFIGVQRVTV
jgi:hypothetical protein